MRNRSHSRVTHQVRRYLRALRYIRCRNQHRLVSLVTHYPELLTQFVETETLLTWVVWHNEYQMAEELLKLGADPNLVRPGDNTLLIHAAAEDDVRMARLLIDYGANLEAANKNLETPLGYACAYGAVNVVRLLCERGADVNGTEGWGNSYLFGVQCHTQSPNPDPNQLEIEKILLAHGAKLIVAES